VKEKAPASESGRYGLLFSLYISLETPQKRLLWMQQPVTPGGQFAGLVFGKTKTFWVAMQCDL